MKAAPSGLTTYQNWCNGAVWYWVPSNTIAVLGELFGSWLALHQSSPLISIQQGNICGRGVACSIVVPSSMVQRWHRHVLQQGTKPFGMCGTNQLYTLPKGHSDSVPLPNPLLCFMLCTLYSLADFLLCSLLPSLSAAVSFPWSVMCYTQKLPMCHRLATYKMLA